MQKAAIALIVGDKMNKYKNFIVTLSSYKCDKHCPYCIAKMNKLPIKRENLDSLVSDLTRLKNEEHFFKSCVISGNGEPSLYDTDFLKELRDIMEEANIFKTKRIQSSGNLFLYDDKFNLFKDWIIEVTRVAHDFDKDNKILKYKHDYMNTENFKKANIRMNIVLLKNNVEHLVDDIKNYLSYSNINNVALKMLDKNSDTKQDKWIEEYGLSYDYIESIKNILSENFVYEEFEFQNHFWNHEGKRISLYENINYNVDKVNENFMWYGDQQLTLR